ncbi:hypothetical protein EV667_0352 [Ancylobacter aquaticus]|uniref:HprK-related kinase B n=1 Tax=Ancylobacter aquaticus TaxID=100 RepID=A0A4R1I4M8_ANCAQ|nr:hypothetical protein [Ancylobacter aquaticus]TCK30264.1 hypothetical protein EV667_0352 [Ancylobacter aquaticus]
MTDIVFPATVDTDPGARSAEPRFYFRVLDDVLFVFDKDRDMAHALNAAAARLFLTLPDAFVTPTALGEASGLGTQDLRDCLGAWEAFGWIERDGAGRVRLRDERAPRPDETRATSLVPAGDESLVDRYQVRLAGSSVAFRLFVSGGGSEGPGGEAALDDPSAFDDAPDPDCFAARLASGRRMFGFFGGFLDPAPDRHPPLATIHLVVTPDGFLLRCGPRRLFTEKVAVAVGKVRLWLLDLVYRHPRPCVFVHGAVLATTAGAVVMAGVSGAGKSTLSAYLVTRGWRFGTDDSLALGFRDGEAVVLPCPGAINVKSGSYPTLLPFHPQLAALPLIGVGEKRGRYLPVPLALHLGPEGGENHVRCFVFPRFEAGAPTRVAAISSSQALLELMDAEFDLAEEAGAAEFDAFFDTLDQLPRYAIVYSDLFEMEAVLRRLVAGEEG